MLLPLQDMQNICKVSKSTITFWKHLSGLFLVKQFSKEKSSVPLFSTLKKKKRRGGSYGVKKIQHFQRENLPVSCQNGSGKNEIATLTQIIC